MIQFANEQTTPLVRQMWKACFNDTDEFLDLYFQYKYKEENTLIFFVDGLAVASLQMLPYEITFYGEKIPFAYLAGLNTLPEYRRKGYMDRLIHKAHEVLKERNIPLSILVPAEEWLFGFYEKYGYEKVFDVGDKPIYPLKKILDSHASLEDSYKAFNTLYADQDFCVQKTFIDFQTIVSEQTIDKFPPRFNIAGMARIMDVPYMLSLYAKNNNSHSFKISVSDEKTIGVYQIMHGNIQQIDNDVMADVNTDIRMLCRLLFGYRTSELDIPVSVFFPEHHPVMNLMLE